MKAIYYTLIALFLLSCQSKTNKLKSLSNKSDTTSIFEARTKVNIKKELIDTVKYIARISDCTRGIAKPILIKSVYPNSIFKLNSDSLTGVETVDLAKGDKLVINNWGCESYVLTFTFETSQYQADTADINFWLDKSVILMRSIEKGLKSPIDINNGLNFIKGLLREKSLYHLGEEMIWDKSEIRSYAILERVQKLNVSKYSIQISFVVGPL